MKIKPGLLQSLTYIVTAALLLYQFLWELTHCCREGEKLQELMKFLTEGWFFLLLLLSGGLLLISGLLQLTSREDVSWAALIATLIGFGYFINGYSLLPVSLLMIFMDFRPELLIVVLSGVMLLISFIISTNKIIRSLRSKG